MPSDPQNFALRPFQEKAPPEVTPRLLDEDEGLDESYPAVGAASEAADGGVPRRKKRNTARLVWDSKPKRAPNPKNLGFQIAEVVVPNPATQSGPRLPFDPIAQDVDTTSCNRLIWGDNLLVMQALLAQGYEGKLNLIYIDPPFDSKADYSHTVQLTPDASGHGGGELNAEMSALERLAYRDTWEDGTDSYLDMLFPRLQLMHRLLVDSGYRTRFGELSRYWPDFLVRTGDTMWLIETKAQRDQESTVVWDKARAALEWCRTASQVAPPEIHLCGTAWSQPAPWRYAILFEDQWKGDATAFTPLAEQAEARTLAFLRAHGDVGAGSLLEQMQQR